MTEKTPANWDPRRAFEQGSFQEIIHRIRPPGRESTETGALIGALAFLGRWVEADELFRATGEKLEPPDRARARLALAAEGTRLSRFARAKTLLRENARDPETSASAEAAQGLAFYFYFLGRFDLAIRWGKRGLRRALAAGDRYLHLLTLDLLAHAFAQSRDWPAAARIFEDAIEVATAAGEKANLEFLRAAVLCYEAEYGLRPRTIVGELEAKIADLATEDTYTRANLVLELARQLTLRGRWTEARAALDAEAPSIYASGNRRQEATLLLRIAEIAFRRGAESEATHLLRSARRCLNRIADKSFELRVSGLEWKVQKYLLGREPEAALTNRLRELAASRPSRLSSQLLRRTGVIPEARGTDPIDEILSKPKGAREEALLEAGYLGLWPLESGLKPGEDCIVVLENGRVVTVSARGVSASKEPWPRQPLALLRRIIAAPAGKERLIADVWGYAYDPLRHDSVIYAGLATLRKWMGPEAAWIETGDDGWRLRAGVRWLDHAGSPPDVKNIAPVASLAPSLAGLNHRQIKALKELEKREFWDIRSYKKTWGVSTMTAWRDLLSLVEHGYLLRLGRGRATRYVPGGEIG